MCLRVFHKLYQDSTVNLPLRKVSAFYLLLLAGLFTFRTLCRHELGRFHYFSAVHKVRAHASHIGIIHHYRSYLYK
jgi:hypothetical protein